MRIVFMGTPEFALPSLKMLVNEGYEVSAVVTQPDKPKGRGNKLTPPPVKEYALDKGIAVLQPEKVRTKDFAKTLYTINPDLAVVVAYGKILPPEVLGVPRLGCINVHGSLLPKYRGAAPMQWAIINGEKTTGVTTIFMDAGMDTGDILLKREVEIPDDMTAGELHDKLSGIGAETLRDTLRRIEEGTLVRMPQCDGEATYAPMLKKDAGAIDWNKPSQEIHNLVRGTNPWPGAFTFYNGWRLRIWKTRTAETSPERVNIFKAGTICSCGREGIMVAAGRGMVNILEIQFDCGRKMGVEECWHNFREGETLG